MNLDEQMRCLFQPQAVAVIGASNTFGKWGFNIFKQLVDKGKGRKVYPVNERETEVLGIRSYRNIGDVSPPIDLAVVVIPQHRVPQALIDCVKKGVKVAIVISAGFGESGEEELERGIANIARESGMRLVGPNCMGHFDTASNLFTSPFVYPKRGPVGVISQSGNVGVNIINYGMEIGLGFSKFINTGNEADLYLEDFLEYLGRDEEIKVIMAYIEGLRDGRRFFDLAKRISLKKPIVVLKIGGTGAGARAARSHTGALAGADEIYAAAFRQAGVVRVADVVELVDVASALLRQPLPKGRRVSILAGGGGFGVIGADACERLNLEVASLSQDTIEKLNAILPSRWSHSNPVDTVGAAAPNPLIVYPCLEAMIEDENIDAILSLSGIGLGTPLTEGEITPIVKEREERELSQLAQLIKDTDLCGKPIMVSCVLTEPRRRSPVFQKLLQDGILVYPTPQRAIRVLAHLVEYSEYLKRREIELN